MRGFKASSICRSTLLCNILQVGEWERGKFCWSWTAKFSTLWVFCATTAGQKKGKGKLVHTVYIVATEINASIVG